MRPKRLLLTGAAGEIGRVLRPALHGTAEAVRWHDLRPIKDAASRRSWKASLRPAARSLHSFTAAA
jgi:hypothetical protein